MTNRFKWAIGLASILLLLGAVSVATGIPLHWSKGVVVGSYCESTEENYLCLVELVPDGSRVKAESELDIPSGRSVELRAWVNPFSGTTTYQVVR